MTHLEKETETSFIAFSWLLRLRWGAVICQAALILIIHLVLGIEIPLAIVFAILGFQGASNFFFHLLQQRRIVLLAWLFAGVMFLDVALLTALLYYTGGPMNPFTFLYLIHIVLGALLMRPKWAWSLMVFTIASYGSFFVVPELASGAASDGSQLQSLCHEPFGSASMMTMHLHGMWVAFSVAAAFIVFFVGRIRKDLEEHQQALDSLREERSRNEKLASLATLAAGAAHELATPLATIAVAAGEMVHHLSRDKDNPQLLDDAMLIRGQVGQCREVLHQMAADAGEPVGEASEEIGVDELIEETLAAFELESRIPVVVENIAGTREVRMPPRTMSRTLRGLLKNAADASPANGSIKLKCWLDNRFLYIEVSDQGSGMDEETLRRATEPFFTRKEPGKGLGLGLYLTKTIAERFGGRLEIRSENGRGTTVLMSIGQNTVTSDQ